MMKFIRKWKYLITGVFGVILIGVLFITKLNLNSNKYEDIEIVSDLTEPLIQEESIQECNVDIKGAILKPGVYSVSCDKNVNDVIEMAGGLAEDADTSVTNLAKKINNEMVIIIYTHEEVENSNIVDTVVKVIEKECVCPNIQNDSCINTEITGNIGEENGLVIINTATLEELMSVPGIGEAKARAIIEYRKNSVFLVLEDLLNVPGIGEKLYETIKVYLTT